MITKINDQKEAVPLDYLKPYNYFSQTFLKRVFRFKLYFC